MKLCRDFYINRTYLTLKDIFELQSQQQDVVFPTQDAVAALFQFVKQINISEFKYPLACSEFLGYIAEATWNNYYCYYDDVEDLQVELGQTLLRITSYLMRTEKRYGKLIELYKENEAKLMDKLSVVSSTKFNDTPQDGGNFTDDDHVSNSSVTETESDPNTIIGRLSEVRGKYKDLYNEWLNEFARKFIIYV